MAVIIKLEKNKDTTLPLPDRLKIGGKLFLEGFRAQATDESTAGVAIAGGLWQGMKYKGDLKKGLKAGAVIELSLCVGNGIRNVVRNYGKAKRARKLYGLNTYKIIREEEPDA